MAGNPSYLALLRVGFAEHPRSPEGLVSSYLTVSPLPRSRTGAVCSLWHFPSRHRDSALRSTLPCGARTFLPPRVGPATARGTSAMSKAKPEAKAKKDKPPKNVPDLPVDFISSFALA